MWHFETPVTASKLPIMFTIWKETISLYVGNLTYEWTSRCESTYDLILYELYALYYVTIHVIVLVSYNKKQSLAHKTSYVNQTKTNF